MGMVSQALGVGFRVQKHSLCHRAHRSSLLDLCGSIRVGRAFETLPDLAQPVFNTLTPKVRFFRVRLSPIVRIVCI